MNEDTFYPKKGWFAEYEKFPRFGGWSFSLGLAKELVQHCMDGYDKPMTHSGYKTYFYAIIFRSQIVLGYNSVEKVSK